MGFSARLFSLFVALVASAPSHGQVTAASRDAVAVRGEPVLIEVRVGADATLPPLTIASSAGVRVAVTGRLVWPFVPARTRGSLMRWAAPANPLRIADERPNGADSAYLAVDIPSDIASEAAAGSLGRAQLFIGASSVSLSVCDAAPADFIAQLATRASMIFPQGERDPALSLPDPDAPFERFRSEFGVAMRAWPEPPAFPEESGSAIVARAYSALWRDALARVFASGSGPAVELAELLVATCADPTAPAPIAAWIAHPDEIRTLLRLALDREFNGARLAASINEFLRVRSPVLWWVEDSDRTSVTLAFANPSTRAQVVRYQWVAGTDTDVLPLVLDVPAAEVRRARIARLAGEPFAKARPARDRPVERLRGGNLGCRRNRGDTVGGARRDVGFGPGKRGQGDEEQDQGEIGEDQLPAAPRAARHWPRRAHATPRRCARPSRSGSGRVGTGAAICSANQSANASRLCSRASPRRSIAPASGWHSRCASSAP